MYNMYGMVMNIELNIKDLWLVIMLYGCSGSTQQIKSADYSFIHLTNPFF